MSFNSIEQIHTFLNSIPQFSSAGKSAASFNLNRFREFVEALGNPHENYHCIHVAGTNGKGSTCQILASIYQEAGYKTGIYTSPHILEYRERFKINGEQISEEKLLTFFRLHEKQIDRFSPTYFELSTAIAFWYFSDQNVDIAVIEVGLGGRLDATNIIKPEVSVITNISLDHTDILGETIQEIAREKAGIIKEEVPVVLGNICREAREVIAEIAQQKAAAIHSTDYLNPAFQQETYILQTEEGERRFKSDLFTPVQAYNIAVAWKVTRLMNDKFSVSERQFSAAVAKVRALYPSLGRFEKLDDRHEWYFDGAHNLEAVRAMKAMTQDIRPVQQSILILSLMRDKASKELLNEFSEFNKILYHELDTRRAARYEYIQQRLPSVSEFPAAEKQINKLLEEFETELVIFAGSFYFYATVRDWLTSFAKGR